MRRPLMRSRGQGSSRRPTPLPSPPVRGGPKGPPVRGVPKTPPKSRPVRGGRRITEPPRPIRGGPKTPPKPPGGRVPKRVKEPLTPIKKTPNNTGTSTRTPQRVPTRAEQMAIMEAARRNVKPKPTTGGQTKKTPPNTGTSTKTSKREKLDAVPVKANPNIKLAKAVSTKTPPNTGQPRIAQLAKNQRPPTAAERKQLMEAALRARVAKAPDKQAEAKAVELQKRLFNDAQKTALKNARPKTPAAPPTGSRAAAMRRRKRSGGLAGALRRARSR